MKPWDKRRLVELELKETRFFLSETIRRARRAEKALRLLEQSTAFELGNAILDVFRSPLGAVRFPSRLVDMVEKRILRNTGRGSGVRLSGKSSEERKNKRLLVAGHDLKFFSPIARSLEQSGKFEVAGDLWSSENSFDLSSAKKRMYWADIVVAEWCLANAVWYSNNIPYGKKLIVRFHLRERASRYPDGVRWKSVDRVIFVSRHVLEQACRMLGVPKQKSTVIPNMIPVRRFVGDKKENARWTIGMLGYTPMRKRLDRALDVFETLWNRDKRWRLRIKGASPAELSWMKAREDELRWYELIEKRIKSSAWSDAVVFDPVGDDVPDWLQAVGYLLSPSDFESFHVAVGEAMASGTIAVIWPWLGCDELWPEEFIVNDTEQAIEFLSGLAADDTERRRLSQKAIEFVKTRYDTGKVMRAWEDLLD